jgi:hypothetical protein
MSDEQPMTTVVEQEVENCWDPGSWGATLSEKFCSNW